MGLQTPAVLQDKDLGKTQNKPGSTRRSKQRISHVDTVKLEVLGDTDPLAERDVEYCPPPVEYPPYESDILPAGGINLDALKGSNRMQGFAQYFNNPLDDNGESIKQKKLDAEQEKAYRDLDAQILKEVEEMDWSISDVPSTKEEHLKKVAERQKAAKLEEQIKRSRALAVNVPSTIASRKAASALSAPARPPLTAVSHERAPVKSTATSALQKPAFLVRSKKPDSSAPVASTTISRAASTAASRSTIGYNKGRSASSVLKAFSPPHQSAARPPQPRTNNKFGRTISNVSAASDSTITPEKYAQQNAADFDLEQFRRLRLVSAFDVDGEEDEDRRIAPEDIKIGGEDDEFVLELSGAL